MIPATTPATARAKVEQAEEVTGNAPSRLNDDGDDEEEDESNEDEDGEVNVDGDDDGDGDGDTLTCSLKRPISPQDQHFLAPSFG